jgi:hypothetical protein
MTKTIKLIASGLLIFPLITMGQKSNAFKIDTAKILANENLNGFVQSMQTDSFQIFETKDAIPRVVKKELNNLTKGFSIANPDKPYRCCCTSPGRLPKRQLNFLAKSNDILVMTYKTGGIGVSTHLLLVKFDKNKIVDLWTGYCWADIKTISDIVYYIDEMRKYNRELNTNIVIL